MNDKYCMISLIYGASQIHIYREWEWRWVGRIGTCPMGTEVQFQDEKVLEIAQ
jgi:hypothetical protein